MAIVSIKTRVGADIDLVWKKVTSLEDYQWRSDLEKIEIMDNGKTFIEYTKGGYKTRFKITVFEFGKTYEFSMENENIIGTWRGDFSPDDGGTVIEFTENVTAKKLLMKPFVKSYLKKQQTTYISDLKKSLEI